MKKLFISFFLIGNLSFAQSDFDLANESGTQSVIKAHIGFLASDELKGRDTGSPELKIAAKYIESRFVEYGVKMTAGSDSYFQPVPMKKTSPPASGFIEIKDDSYRFKDDFLLLEGSNVDISGNVAFVDFGTEKDLKKAKVEGKIVFALCGDGESQTPQEWFSQAVEKRKRAKEMGAIALVELYYSPQLPWSVLVRFLGREQVGLDTQDIASIPHIWMNRSAEDMASLKDKKLTSSILIEGASVETFNSQNIVGFVEGTDPELKNEYVVYSAHYDHVGIGRPDDAGDAIYNGARDNAVGTVTVLSAAQNIAKNPTRRSALFVLFTAEEKGLLGSQYLVENPPVPLNQMVYCFNSDNGGYNDTSLATIIGLTRTSAQEMIIDACQAFGLKATEDPVEEQGLFDRSDNVRFAAKGIPAPTFGMGFTAFDEEITKYYHQPGDEPETLDYEYLEKFFKAYVYACRLIGNADKAPFWNEGDKYYQAGIDLYKKSVSSD